MDEDSPVEEEDLSLEIKIAMAAIDKAYGKGTIYKLDSDKALDWPSLKTGAPTLDNALGIGGIPIGRITEIYGEESAGKTTLALEIMAEAHKLGWTTAFIDAEHALDPQYAQRIGVDLSKVLISQPDYGEQALDIVEDLLKTGQIKLIVVDSVAGLQPKAELEGTMEDQQMGLQARMMSKGMRRIPRLTNENDAIVIFINQIREKIGIVYGTRTTTPGGRGLKFAASTRIELRRSAHMKDKQGGDQPGIEVTAKVVKNKMAAPFRSATYSIIYGSGIDTLGSYYDLAVEAGIFKMSGAWVKLGTPLLNYKEGDSFAQGRDNAIQTIATDLALLDEIKKKLNLE
jgi:recombination protein RecA